MTTAHGANKASNSYNRRKARLPDDLKLSRYEKNNEYDYLDETRNQIDGVVARRFYTQRDGWYYCWITKRNRLAGATLPNIGDQLKLLKYQELSVNAQTGEIESQRVHIFVVEFTKFNESFSVAKLKLVALDN